MSWRGTQNEEGACIPTCNLQLATNHHIHALPKQSAHTHKHHTRTSDMASNDIASSPGKYHRKRAKDRRCQQVEAPTYEGMGKGTGKEAAATAEAQNMKRSTKTASGAPAVRRGPGKGQQVVLTVRPATPIAETTASVSIRKPFYHFTPLTVPHSPLLRPSSLQPLHPPSHPSSPSTRQPSMTPPTPLLSPPPSLLPRTPLIPLPSTATSPPPRPHQMCRKSPSPLSRMGPSLRSTPTSRHHAAATPRLSPWRSARSLSTLPLRTSRI